MFEKKKLKKKMAKHGMSMLLVAKYQVALEQEQPDKNLRTRVEHGTHVAKHYSSKTQ